MTDDAAKDPAVARALEQIPVPDYEPGFWDRLEAQLEARGGPGASRRETSGGRST